MTTALQKLPPKKARIRPREKAARLKVSLAGSVMVSEALFPFPDGPTLAAEAARVCDRTVPNLCRFWVEPID